MHHADLMRQIERIGRFVEQHELGILCQQSGNRDTLAFSAREAAHIALRQIGHIELLQRSHGDIDVILRFPIMRIVIRMAGAQYRLDGAVTESINPALRQKSALFGQIAQRPGGDVFALHLHLPAIQFFNRTQPRQSAQQSAFTRAVAADHAPAFTRLYLPLQVLEQNTLRNRQTEMGGLHQRRHQRLLNWCSCSRKTGTPMIAVITPTGNCCGETIDRASASASTRKLPPARVAAGISRR